MSGLPEQATERGILSSAGRFMIDTITKTNLLIAVIISIMLVAGITGYSDAGSSLHAQGDRPQA